MKYHHHMLMLRDNTLSKYHLTIQACSFILPSCEDKFNLTRVLIASFLTEEIL
jgi:hypothetical protein